MRTDVDDDAVFCSRMASLVERLVEAVRFDAESMSLCLTFEGGARLVLEPDPAGEREDPQWDVSLPDQRVVLVFGERRWALEASKHTDRALAEGDAEFIVELLTPPYTGGACSAW